MTQLQLHRALFLTKPPDLGTAYKQAKRLRGSPAKTHNSIPIYGPEENLVVNPSGIAAIYREKLLRQGVEEKSRH
jgi:hypothetical protein